MFTDRDTFLLQREQFPDIHLIIKVNLSNFNELKGKIYELVQRGLRIDAVLSLVDPYCYTACELAKEFGVLRFSDSSIYTMQNKILSKSAISKTQHCKFFKELSSSSSMTKKQVVSNLPLILKSPNSTGSKDVYKVDSYDDFLKKFNVITSKYPKETVLVESFIHGTQYIVETIMYQGKMYIVAIIEQEITYINEHFIVTGYSLVLDYDEQFYNLLQQAVAKIISCHGMTTGTCHLEMKYIDNQWILIEINPRMSGGGMNQLLLHGLGINLAEETVKLALGFKPDFEERITKQNVYAKYVVLSKGGLLKKVTGRNRAKKCPGVKEVYIKPRKGTYLNPPKSMGDRYAYVIATGENKEMAKSNAVNAVKEICFLISCKEKNEEVENDTVFCAAR